jgi:hypothetical protein
MLSSRSLRRHLTHVIVDQTSAMDHPESWDGATMEAIETLEILAPAVEYPRNAAPLTEVLLRRFPRITSLSFDCSHLSPDPPLPVRLPLRHLKLTRAYDADDFPGDWSSVVCGLVVDGSQLRSIEFGDRYLIHDSTHWTQMRACLHQLESIVLGNLFDATDVLNALEDAPYPSLKRLSLSYDMSMEVAELILDWKDFSMAFRNIPALESFTLRWTAYSARAHLEQFNRPLMQVAGDVEMFPSLRDISIRHVIDAETLLEGVLFHWRSGQPMDEQSQRQIVNGDSPIAFRQLEASVGSSPPLPPPPSAPPAIPAPPPSGASTVFLDGLRLIQECWSLVVSSSSDVSFAAGVGQLSVGTSPPGDTRTTVCGSRSCWIGAAAAAAHPAAQHNGGNLPQSEGLDHSPTAHRDAESQTAESDGDVMQGDVRAQCRVASTILPGPRLDPHRRSPRQRHDACRTGGIAPAHLAGTGACAARSSGIERAGLEAHDAGSDGTDRLLADARRTAALLHAEDSDSLLVAVCGVSRGPH